MRFLHEKISLETISRLTHWKQMRAASVQDARQPCFAIGVQARIIAAQQQIFEIFLDGLLVNFEKWKHVSLRRQSLKPRAESAKVFVDVPKSDAIPRERSFYRSQATIETQAAVGTRRRQNKIVFFLADASLESKLANSAQPRHQLRLLELLKV